MTPTNSILSRAGQVFEIVDDSGRRLTVRRLNALDRLRLLKAAGAELSQNDAWLNMAALALSVSEVNGIPRVTPTTERQIEAMVAELGDDGLQKVSDVLSENNEATLLLDGEHPGNAVGTPI